MRTESHEPHSGSTIRRVKQCDGKSADEKNEMSRNTRSNKSVRKTIRGDLSLLLNGLFMVGNVEILLADASEM